MGITYIFDFFLLFLTKMYYNLFRKYREWGEVLKTDDLFDQILIEISGQVNSNMYTTWFSKLKLISIDSDIVKIQVPMEVHKQMLSNQYNHIIENAFFTITGKNYKFEYYLEKELQQEEQLIENPIEAKEKLLEPRTDRITWNTNLRKEYTFDNYIVGSTNNLAYVSAKAVAENPGVLHNPLFIYGRSGLGKTHLMQAIGNYITEHTDLKVLYTSSYDFMNEYAKIASFDKGASTMEYVTEFKNKYRNVDVLIIDDIQFLVDAKRTQDEFFQTFEALHQANKQIIISSDRSPDDLKKIEDRLRSRFWWGLPVDIYPPDFDLRCNIIKAKIKNTTMENKLNEDIIKYIATNCVNDVRHIEGTINRLIAYTAMMVPEKITLDFAKEALVDCVSTNMFVSNSIESIQKTVADYFNITVSDLKSKKKHSSVVRPRHIAMYLCRMETEENLSKIGFEFGGRDHSTVSTAIDKMTEEIKNDTNLKKIVDEIKDKLK